MRCDPMEEEHVEVSQETQARSRDYTLPIHNDIGFDETGGGQVQSLGFIGDRSNSRKGCLATRDTSSKSF